LVTKKTNKALKIGIPIGVVVLLIIISLATVLGSTTRPAFLNIEEGEVQVDVGKGWVAAQDGMKLSEDDSVRTLEGKAVLVLYESIIVQMDENTEVSIAELSKKHTKLDQKSGSTWNKFMAITGIDSYEVETPTTVATVRGTEFWVDMESVGVSEGEVEAKIEGKSMTVKSGHKALREGVKVVPFSEQDRQRSILKKQIVIKHLKNLRVQEIEKHKTTYNLVKKTRGWDDADVQRYMDKVDRGELDVDRIKEGAKLPAKSIDKFAAISKEIQKNAQEIEQLQVMKAGEQPDIIDIPTVRSRIAQREASGKQEIIDVDILRPKEEIIDVDIMRPEDEIIDIPTVEGGEQIIDIPGEQIIDIPGEQMQHREEIIDIDI
jgi:hypothetical protein